MVNKLKDDPATPAAAREVIEEKLGKLLEQITEVNPDRCVAVYMVGESKVGKSSLINAILDIPDYCKVGDGLKPETVKFQECIHQEARINFLDTQGLTKNYNPKKFMKETRGLLKKKELPLPDVIVLCIVPSRANECAYLRDFVERLRRLCSEFHKPDVPTVLVLNQIDTKAKDDESYEQTFGRLIGEIESIYPEFDVHLGTSAKKNFGIESLRHLIQEQQKVANKIDRNDIHFAENCCETLAVKVISGFCALNAVVSTLPFVDIPITSKITSIMLDVLEVFAVDSTKTASGFLQAHGIAYQVSSYLRMALMFVGDILDLTVVGIALGTAINLSSSVGLTAAIGWKAYKYFTTP